VCDSVSAIGLEENERRLWPQLRERLRVPGQSMALMRGVLGDAEVVAVPRLRPRWRRADGRRLLLLHPLRQLLGEPAAVLPATAQTDPGDPQVDLGMTATLAFPGGRTGTVRASFLGQDTAGAVTTIRGSAGMLEITWTIYVPQWAAGCEPPATRSSRRQPTRRPATSSNCANS
jgi:predicted dehydrogenase